MAKNSKVKLIVFGACGRMGTRIITLANESKVFDVMGALETKNHPNLGNPIEETISGWKGRKLFISSELEEVIGDCQVMIDFTHPDSTIKHLRAAVKAKKALVIGTTGFSKPQLAEIKRASKKIPIVQAPNMSIGVNVVFQIAELLGSQLDNCYDVEIVETHHKFKKDAPSGTALELADRVSKGRKVQLDQVALYGRKGFTGERKKGSIGIHALRGGDVVGEHRVRFITHGESIEVFHHAANRDSFASGALRAAQFLAKKRTGFFTMKDVLGLK